VPRLNRVTLELVRCILAVSILAAASCQYNPSESNVAIDKAVLAEQVKEALRHGWRGYKRYAWGHDDLKPLSKSYHDWYSQPMVMTPVDSLDTMLLMGLEEEAREAKELVLEKLSFDLDAEVQVFEINIRMLGGLLSAYQIDGDERFLALARDLADRLLPAFDSPTGMPYRFVHLRSGATRDAHNNPAEIGTLIIELGTLSKLTGDPRYYDTAKRALLGVFERRSTIGLPGTVIDVNTGEWINRESHIGGRIDSYYEYMLKAAILFDDSDFRNMWEMSVAALNRYLADTTDDGLWYARVDMETGEKIGSGFGALEAFMPAVLALGGDLERARALQDSCYKIWTTFGIEPEQIDYENMEILNPAYVLRPENLESAYYLSQLTGDEQYLEMGKTMFDSIMRYCRVDAGFAAIDDVRTMEKRDEMQSFFLAETLKYAYLLFAPDPPVSFQETIFTTEAHPIRKTW
jgi:mannosidase alpha-like ER degradation enhancer 2